MRPLTAEIAADGFPPEHAATVLRLVGSLRASLEHLGVPVDVTNSLPPDQLSSVH